MPRKTSYKHYDLNSVQKRTFSVDTFKGVDYRPSQLNVDDRHAVDIKNIIYKDNVDQTRKGWQQIFNMIPIKYFVLDANGNYVEKENPVAINGVWSFVGIDNKEYIIAHIGSLLFKVDNIGVEHPFYEIEVNPLLNDVVQGTTTIKVADIELPNVKTKSFYSNQRLYILTGDKYLVVRAENDNINVALVEDDYETYIPTTTIGITSKDSKINGLTPLDDVNLLTQFRKNKLVTGTYFDDGVSVRTTKYWDYELDTSVKPKSKKDMNNIKITIQSLKEVV